MAKPARSSLETKLETQLRLLGVPAWEIEYRFHPTRRWRWDLCWRDRMLAVEVQGQGRHNRFVGQAADCEKLSTAAILGWRVIVCNALNVRTGDAARWIQEATA